MQSRGLLQKLKDTKPEKYTSRTTEMCEISPIKCDNGSFNSNIIQTFKYVYKTIIFTFSIGHFKVAEN